MIQLPPNLLGFPSNQLTTNPTSTPDRHMAPYRSYQCARCEVFGQVAPCWSCDADGPLLVWNRSPSLSTYHRWPPEPIVASHNVDQLEAADRVFYEWARAIQDAPD